MFNKTQHRSKICFSVLVKIDVLKGSVINRNLTKVLVCYIRHLTQVWCVCVFVCTPSNTIPDISKHKWN